MRLLVFLAAAVFIAGMATLTALYLANNGLTLVGVLGLLVLIVCGVGVLGAFFQPPRR